MRLFVAVSGLPGSGKSTLGRAVAASLSLPFFDKDEILESLFVSLGVGDAAWRSRLSRAADHLLGELVERSAGAVVVSWWRHPLSEMDSGTDTAWLLSLSGRVVELHCDCRAEVAADRFFGRARHAGHLDGYKSVAEELSKFQRVRALGPLGVGPVFVCNTEFPVDVRAVTGGLNELAR